MSIDVYFFSLGVCYGALCARPNLVLPVFVFIERAWLRVRVRVRNRVCLLVRQCISAVGSQ